MQGLTDLQNDVAAIGNSIGAVRQLVLSLQVQITTLQATIAAGGDNDADVAAQAKLLEGNIADLNAIVNPATVSVAATPST